LEFTYVLPLGAPKRGSSGEGLQAIAGIGYKRETFNDIGDKAGMRSGRFRPFRGWVNGIN